MLGATGRWREFIAYSLLWRSNCLLSFLLFCLHSSWDLLAPMCKQPSASPQVFEASACITGKALSPGPVTKSKMQVALCVWSPGAFNCSWQQLQGRWFGDGRERHGTIFLANSEGLSNNKKKMTLLKIIFFHFFGDLTSKIIYFLSFRIKVFLFLKRPFLT